MPKQGRLHMPVDVNYWDDPVIVSLSLEAGVFFQRLMFSSWRLKTEGIVLLRTAQREAVGLGDTDALLVDLVGAELIQADPQADSFKIPSWEGWHGASKLKQEAGRKGGLASADARQRRSRPQADQQQLLSSDGQPNKEQRTKNNGLQEEPTGLPPLLGFEEFWTVYPKRNGRKVGRDLCEAAWPKLSIEDRRSAHRGAVNLARDVAAGLTLPKDPIRFLQHRVWVDFQTAPDATAQHFDPARPSGGLDFDPDAPSIFDQQGALT